MARTKQTAPKAMYDRSHVGPMKTLTKPTKHPPASGGVIAAQAPAAAGGGAYNPAVQTKHRQRGSRGSRPGRTKRRLEAATEAATEAVEKRAEAAEKRAEAAEKRAEAAEKLVKELEQQVAWWWWRRCRPAWQRCESRCAHE